MREIKPYKTLAGLAKAIDNGGRFYNFFSHANDDTVSRGELAKAAGVFRSGDNAFLFLEMARHELSTEARLAVERMLEPELRASYQRQRPQIMLPSAVDAKGKAGTAIVVTGYARFVENKTEFNGFVMVPISAGKTVSFIMVPIYDQFDVYEVFDDKQMGGPSSLVARSHGKRLEHSGPVRFGGMLRELKARDDVQPSHPFYLEAVFYTRL